MTHDINTGYFLHLNREEFKDELNNIAIKCLSYRNVESVITSERDTSYSFNFQNVRDSIHPP